MSEAPEYADFVSQLAKLLRTDSASLLSSELSAFPGFDSLAKIEVALLVEALFDTQISQEQLELCRTARDIFDAATQI